RSRRTTVRTVTGPGSGACWSLGSDDRRRHPIRAVSAGSNRCNDCFGRDLLPVEIVRRLLSRRGLLAHSLAPLVSLSSCIGSVGSLSPSLSSPLTEAMTALA